ncbi:hypothetical protein RA224_13015 [Achromobacter aegrifaciens]|uniref:hypothetical protein n=1 Tax=Achromobacter aegrifaciens TaxID=1287736 RepID=UPI0027BAFE5A|nr:hypothetical protein [Achromobacter aegrifaciens]WLW64306.1 hypothetical protein RA224_13015 [Achromobacter aegrifaciens]
MSARILTAERGRVTRFLEADGRYGIETTADVEPVLEHAKALHNEGRQHAPNGDQHLARIHITVLNAWAQRRGVTFADVMNDVRLLEEFLRDPDNAHFRVNKDAI